MHPSLSPNADIVPGVLLKDVLGYLNDANSGFPHRIVLDELQQAPTIRTLSEGKGFCSTVYSVTFHTAAGDCAIAVKVPGCTRLEKEDTTEEEKEANFQYISTYHRNELRVYRLLKKYVGDDVKVLNFFGGREWSREQSGFLLLEDASAKVAVEKFTGLKTFQIWQVEEAIVEIAKMQAYSLKCPRNETVGYGKTPQMMLRLHEIFRRCLSELEERNLPFLTPQRLAALRGMNCPQQYNAISTANQQENLPSVLVHDDFWVGNMLFSPDGHLVALIDWQAGRFASFGNDLGQLLSLTLTGEDRRRHESHFLRFYIDQLHRHLELFEVRDAGGFEKLTFDSVHRIYRESLKWAQVNVVLCFLHYDSLNPSSEAGGESPLLNRLRCCLEDLWP